MAAEPARLRDLELNPEEAFVLSRLSQGEPVRSIILSTGLPEAQARSLLASLLDKGAVGVGDSGPPAVQRERQEKAASSPSFRPSSRSSSPTGQAPRSFREGAGSAGTRSPASSASQAFSSSRSPSATAGQSGASAVGTRAGAHSASGPSSSDMRSAGTSRFPGRAASASVNAGASAAERRSRHPAGKEARKGSAQQQGARKVGGASRLEPLYGDFRFPADELNENVELDLDKKKEILFLYYQREKLSHFVLLGVAADASHEEIRKAYLARSREFHPDRFFRKRLGSYQEKIQDIFHRLRVATDVLSDPESRRRYEVDSAHLFSTEEKAALVARELSLLETERRLAEGRRRLLRSKGFLKLTRARELVAEGEKLQAEGDWAGALERFKHAAELDPRLEVAKQRMAELHRESSVRRVKQALARAIEEERDGKFEQAESTVRMAIGMDESNPEARLQLVSLLLRRGTNLRDAKIHVQRALALGAEEGRGRRLHGEVLMALGQKREGRAEIQAAATAGDETAKQLLKRV